MLKLLAGIIMRVMGWRMEGRPPQIDKFVVTGAPHTSNWDTIIFLCSIILLDLEPRYLAKESAFFWPVGPILRAFGGIPIDRSSPHNLVEQMATLFRQSDRLVLCIAPEGTRGAGDRWKSGFYRIAQAAGVPVVPAALDFQGKLLTIGEPIEITGNMTADMDRLRAFYAGRSSGKAPELVAPIRLKEEIEVAEPEA